jgi:glycosyltransferase involved in cell wall biosynthesis
MDASSRAKSPGTAGHSGSKSTLAESGSESDAPVPDLSRLRVALVHDWLTGMRGGEKCLEVLCRAFPRALLYTLIHRRGSTSPAIESMTIRTSPLQHVPGVFRHYRHLLPLMPMAASTWKLRNVDLVVSLSHCVAKAVQPPPGVPHICYCFTPMRYAWQGREAYLEGWADRPIRRSVAGTLLNHLRDWDRATARRVTQFVAISQTIRERIAVCYHRDSVVIPPPVDTVFYNVTAGQASRENFYLIVSALVPYKKIDQAVAACSRLGRPLIVIGAGPERTRLEAIAGPTARFLGWQPDEVIRDHYRRCRALLFPGEEDFGIVPIEALACGAPVIALGRGGVAETVDLAVGRTYRESSAEALEAAIMGWEAEGCPHSSELGRARAEAYALPVYRRRLLMLLAEAAGVSRRAAVPPAPHLADLRG